jgi:hypothetical protein
MERQTDHLACHCAWVYMYMYVHCKIFVVTNHYEPSYQKQPQPPIRWPSDNNYKHLHFYYWFSKGYRCALVHTVTKLYIQWVIHYVHFHAHQRMWLISPADRGRKACEVTVHVIISKSSYYTHNIDVLNLRLECTGTCTWNPFRTLVSTCSYNSWYWIVSLL